MRTNSHAAEAPNRRVGCWWFDEGDDERLALTTGYAGCRRPWTSGTTLERLHADPAGPR